MGIPRKVSDLGEMSEAEKRVLEELDSGEVTVLGDGARPKPGEQARKVRASLIRLLLGDYPDPKYRPHERGLHIVGAWIPDLLDLEGCRDLPDLGLLNCHIDVAPVLRSARVGNLHIVQSHMPGLFADRLHADGNVSLRGVEATGEVRLLGARLGGDLDCLGAMFWAERDANGNSRFALAADGLEVRGGAFLRNVEAMGGVSLVGAKLGANLECDGAKFFALKDERDNSGVALAADRLLAAGGVFMRNLFEATGGVRLHGAKLGDNLDCDGATFRAGTNSDGKQGFSINASGMETTGSVLLRGSILTGPVVLPVGADRRELQLYRRSRRR